MISACTQPAPHPILSAVSSWWGRDSEWQRAAPRLRDRDSQAKHAGAFVLPSLPRVLLSSRQLVELCESQVDKFFTLVR